MGVMADERLQRSAVTPKTAPGMDIIQGRTAVVVEAHPPWSWPARQAAETAR